jgi:outer membrane protein OmpA-like peptidoglycan-associated protein/Tol biopolymer transport system component
MNKRFLYPKILFLFLLFSIACTTTQSLQNNNLTDDISHAEQLLARGQYLESEKAFLRILNLEPAHTLAVMGLSQVYLEQGKRQEAINLLEEQELIEAKPIFYSRLSALYTEEGRLSESIDQLKMFQNSIGTDHPNYQKAQGEIDKLKYAQEVISRPYDISVTPLPSPINSEDSEYQPRFTLDESVIVFTRKIRGQEDLFEASLKDSVYSVEPISAVNTSFNEGSQTISGDGKYLIFTHCNEKAGFGSCDLYESIYSDGQWSRPKNLGPTINSSAWETQPSLTADGQELYFASNRPGGVGESDIWHSYRTAEGWTRPTPLSSVINTTARDESPFIHADGKTLYFRSTGHKGIGSYDLYMSQSKEGRWMSPINLGYPINSLGEERDLVVNLEGTKAYFSSDTYLNVKNDHLDIYQFELPEDFRPAAMTYMRCEVLSHTTHQPLPAQVTITNIETNETIAQVTVDPSGHFLRAVPQGTKLALHVFYDGYTFYSDFIYYPDLRHGQNPYTETIYLQKLPTATVTNNLQTQEPVILRNIFFATGSAELLAQSEPEIRYLYNFLKDNDYKIQIIGHTDQVGSEDDNLTLSINRSKAVKERLIQKGILEKRIEAIGKGESEPIAENTSDEGRAINRRTEFIIIN